MPRVVSDVIDVYVFRRLNARVQFMLLQRKSGVSQPNTWQSCHGVVKLGETTLAAVQRIVNESTGMTVDTLFSADYLNQFYDEHRDMVVLAPVFAVTVAGRDNMKLGDDFRDAAWFDRDDCTIRLPFSGQRWAVRHIDEIMSMGEEVSNIYRLDTDIWQPTQGIADSIDLPEDEPEAATAKSEETAADTVAETPDSV